MTRHVVVTSQFWMGAGAATIVLVVFAFGMVSSLVFLGPDGPAPTLEESIPSPNGGIQAVIAHVYVGGSISDCEKRVALLEASRELDSEAIGNLDYVFSTGCETRISVSWGFSGNLLVDYWIGDGAWTYQKSQAPGGRVRVVYSPQ